MRTKVERNCKKIAEQKLSLSLASPKVVLNASDCARLLDGTGKTSVLLAERKSKMVTAASRVLTRSSPASSSTLTTSSLPSGSLISLPSVRSISSVTVPATQTKLCKSSASSAKSNKPAEGSDTVRTERLSSTNTDGSLVHQDESKQTKVILKPPKKRRGIDKKFEDASSVTPIFNNGDAVHPCISSNGILTGIGSLQKDADAPLLISPSKGDISKKHSIEHLLQHQMASSIIASNSQTLMAGSYSHDSRTQCDLSSSPLTTLSSTLSTSSSIPDDYSEKALHRISELHTHGHHSPKSQDNHTFISQSTNCKHFGKTRSREHSPSLAFPHSLSASKIVTHSECFHQFPEQEEPMNLSTYKPAIELLPFLASAKTDSKTIEDVSVVSQHSHPKDITLILDTPSSSIAEMSQHTPEGKQVKQSENNSLDMPQAISFHASLSSDLQGMNPPVHSGATSVESRVKENCGISKKSDSSVDSHRLSEPVLLSYNNKAEVQHGVPTLIEQNTSNPSLSISQSSYTTTHSTSLPQISSSVDSQVVDITKHKYDSPDFSEEPSRTSEKEVLLRAKRPPKKRIEVPMDEVSCADRLHRYSLTINDVVDNFVFTPKPLEDFLLTEEEEAAIRDQFENVSSSEEADVNASQCRNDREIGFAGHKVQTGLQDDNDKPSVNSETVMSPKKCLIAADEDRQTGDQCHDSQTTVNNIDSILAFVAGDVENTAPPVSGCGKNLEADKRKRVNRKLKQTGEFVKENAKGNKALKMENIFHKGNSLSNADSLRELDSAREQNDKVDVSTSCDGKPAEVTQSVLKPKKAKRRKCDVSIIQSTTLVQSPTVVQSTSVQSTSVQSPTVVQSSALVHSSTVEQISTLISTTDEVLNTNIVTLVKKKRTEGKFRKRKSDVKKQKVLSVDAAGLSVDKAGLSADKDIAGSHRAETSDIGESIASTSGGSEQDTPVHEPESKDEMVCSGPQVTNRENHDTGLESEEDDNKPVRRYKKRLDFVKCVHCDHQARGRSALSRHMKKVHMLDVNMPYKCQHCEYGCTKMASLNRHLFTHGVYPCSRCNFVAAERILLTQHIMEQHKDKLNMKLCKMCNRYIKCDQITIEQHVQECQGPTPFKCTECDKEFRYSSSLRVHYHTHFPNQPKRFGCEQCDYRTNYKANLHKHHKNMHASRDRDVQCPDCGKLFSTEDNMRRHKKVHTMIRPFACETCEKTFKTSGALKGHQLIHTATRPYTCNIPGCNRSFRTPKFMKSHQEEFHRLVPKKFFCTVDGCNYSFFKRSHLKRHAITHTGERNYHCTWPGCNKSFRHADNLKVHFRSHTNEKPVQCHLCDFKCKQKNSLFWHKKKVHQVIDVLAYPKRLGHKLKLVETENTLEAATVAGTAEAETGSSQVTPAVADNLTPALRLETSDHAPKNVENEEDKSVSFEHSVGTQTVLHDEQGLLDLYEFKSDDESGEETPGQFRRDKAVMNVLTPLPPPPKELLHKIEIQEMKEKEKKEKADRKEQEKKEKMERRDQEKKEKAEKKKLEKMEKAERKQQEKKEIIRQKELERKENLEKKMLEKKEKIEKMELQKKEKEEKKEQERKEKIERKEQEKKERIEKKEREKKEKAERKEAEQKEKTEKKSAVKKPVREKLDDVENKVSAEEEVKTKKSAAKNCAQSLRRKKSPAPAAAEESMVCHEKLKRGKKIREVDEHSTKENEDVGASVSKRKKVATKKLGESSSASPGTDSSTKVAVLKKGISERMKKGKRIPPKRKPSARIKARRAATAKQANAAGTNPRTSKAGMRKKSGRKKVVLKSKEIKEVKQDNEMGVKTKTDDDQSKADDDQSIKKPEENEIPLKSCQEETLVPPVRPSSPAYSEEIMLQGKASPYRDFSDAEDLEDDETEEEYKIESPSSSLSQEQPKCLSPQDKSETEVDLQSVGKIDICTIDRHSHPVEEYSDNEVSNDIPLTPPRAPAPPPVESSEDEMEPEPEQTPFSVPGPNTPFSVHGPHTPFSVPPPTNLMQQHSVHSEEAPMPALPSVPSMEMHSQGSVDMQQSLGSVEMHPHGSVEMNHPHGSVEMHHPHGSVEMHHPHGSVEMHHSQGSVEVRSHNSVEMRSHGSVEMVQSLGSVEIQHSHRSVSESMPHSDQNISSMRTPESVIRESNSNSLSEKYDLPQSLQEQTQASDADKEYFDQYLKSLSAANNRAASGGLGHSPSGLQQLEAMVCKSHLDAREMSSRSPISSLPISVITSLESTLSLLPHGDLHSRMDSFVSDRHHESLYVRDTASSLPRLPDRQTPLPTNHPCPTPSFDAFSSLNPLHPVAASGARENSYLRQSDKLFPTPPSTSSFMAEAMFQRQAMTTPFLPPQPSDKNSLSRMPDTTPLRSSSSASLLRRSGTVQDPDMFSPSTMSRAVPRHPFANPWASQEVRPAHWQTPYLQRQPNMATTGSFFPTKENYLMGQT